MKAESSRELHQAQHWLLLKQAWNIWHSGKPMPHLPEETRIYFEKLSFFRFNSLLALPEFSGVPRVEEPKDAWAHVIRCFTAKRPIASLYLLEDIFSRARERARELGLVSDDDRIEFYVGVLINQFQMRIGEAVTAYAREFGTLSMRQKKVSLDEPTTNQDHEGETTRLERTRAPDQWGSETEMAEVAEIGPKVAEGYFPGIRPVFKLSIFLRSLRLRRCVTISCDHATVVELAGVKKAVFADGAKKILEREFPLHVKGHSECEDLDGTAVYQVCLSAMIALLDRTDLWFWLASWLQEVAAERKDLTPQQFADRATAFLELLEESLKEAGDLSSENAIRDLSIRLRDPK
jgi:hypothetical protein